VSRRPDNLPTNHLLQSNVVRVFPRYQITVAIGVTAHTMYACYGIAYDCHGNRCTSVYDAAAMETPNIPAPRFELPTSVLRKPQRFRTPRAPSCNGPGRSLTVVILYHDLCRYITYVEGSYRSRVNHISISITHRRRKRRRKSDDHSTTGAPRPCAACHDEVCDLSSLRIHGYKVIDVCVRLRKRQRERIG